MTAVRHHIRTSVICVAAALVAGFGLVTPAGASTTAAVPEADPSGSLTLGYFANVTHAPALVALQGGYLAKALGPNVTLKTAIFNAGPAEVTAILSGAIDAGYIGPNPTVTAYTQSHGAIQVISGAASGGAYLVVKPNITKAADLQGKVIATPQLGNTQDVALRSWLKKNKLSSDTSGGGDVSIRPQDNAVTLTSFQQNSIQGAWVPEPWATRLVTEGGGKILVDESTLWPAGKYVTTDLIVRTAYLKAHPDIVERLLLANVQAIDLITKPATSAPAQALVATKINSDTGKPLAANLIEASFENIDFTVDPVASSLQTSAKNAVGLGLPGSVAITNADLKKLYNLKLLNKVLKAQGKPTVSVTAAP